MAAKKGGLGRGLDALFADNSIEEIASTSAVKLKIMDIEPNRDQPRKIFDEDALAELADSIAKHASFSRFSCARCRTAAISSSPANAAGAHRAWRV